MATVPLVGLLTGDRAELRVLYKVAAALGRWQGSIRQQVLARVDVDVSARVIMADEFWSHQRPIDLWLWMGRAYWVWRNVDVLGPIGSTVEITAHGQPEAVKE